MHRGHPSPKCHRRRRTSAGEAPPRQVQRDPAQPGRETLRFSELGEVPVSLLESAASTLAIDPSKMGKHEIPDNWRDTRTREHGSLLSVPQTLLEGTGVELETYGQLGIFESVTLYKLGLQGSLDKRIRDTEQSEEASVRIKR